MRTDLFGDLVIDSVDDYLGSVEALRKEGWRPFKAYVRRDEDGGDLFYFTVMRTDGDGFIVKSDSIFETREAVVDYLWEWVSDVDFE